MNGKAKAEPKKLKALGSGIISSPRVLELGPSFYVKSRTRLKSRKSPTEEEEEEKNDNRHEKTNRNGKETHRIKVNLALLARRERRCTISMPCTVGA